MKPISLFLSFLLVSTIALAGDKSKTKKVFKGYDGIEIHEIFTDTGNYFVFSYRDKLSNYDLFSSSRFDSTELRAFAVNFAELAKPSYTDWAQGSLTRKKFLLKLEGEIRFTDGNGRTALDVKNAPVFAKAILDYFGDMDSSQYSSLIVVKNERSKKIFAIEDKIELKEIRDSKSYFRIIITYGLRSTRIAIFSLDTLQVRILAEVCQQLTDPKYGNGASSKISNELGVEKKENRYFLGRFDGSDDYITFSRIQALEFANAIRHHFGDEPIPVKE